MLLFAQSPKVTIVHGEANMTDTLNTYIPCSIEGFHKELEQVVSKLTHCFKFVIHL